MGEQTGEQQHEGERYLQLLGLEDIADREITTQSGTVIQARDFLDVCGDQALPALKGLEAMSPEDPNFDVTRDMLRGFIGQWIGGEVSQ